MRTTLHALALIAMGASAAMADSLREEVEGYMDFATEAEGIILPQQLTEDIFDQVHFIDTRSAESHAEATIPGAGHIEWREVPGRLDELPETGMVVLFCNTGVRSSQATFAARLLGRSNVLVLQGGYDGWVRDGAYRPE